LKGTSVYCGSCETHKKLHDSFHNRQTYIYACSSAQHHAKTKYDAAYICVLAQQLEMIMLQCEQWSCWWG